MKIEIDQSGKIEQTNKNTILCLSNDDWDAVLIKSQTKRQIQEIFRRNGQVRNFILFTFSAGLAILIRRNRKHHKITIDQEYLGKGNIIKSLLLEMLKEEKGLLSISFAHIGKQSHAHFHAKEVANRRRSNARMLSLKEILKQIKMTEVGKRLKDA